MHLTTHDVWNRLVNDSPPSLRCLFLLKYLIRCTKSKSCTNSRNNLKEAKEAMSTVVGYTETTTTKNERKSYRMCERDFVPHLSELDRENYNIGHID